MATDFSRRLTQACDNSPNVPELSRGRYVVIAKRFGVSEEAVRKWFHGESRPRVATITKLAEWLEVDEAWLALGISPGVSRKEKRVWAERASGAAYVVFGMLTAAGVSCAFSRPEEADRVSLYAIAHGEQTGILVAAAREIAKDKYAVVLPPELEGVEIVVYVPRDGMWFDLVKLEPGAVPRLAKQTSDKMELAITRSKKGYSTGRTVWRPVREPSDIL